MRLILLCTAAAVTLLSAACAGVPPAAGVPLAAGAAPRLEAAECKLSVRGRGLECGTLVVPEVRAQADNGRTISIQYAILKAQNTAAARPDPVVFLTGGPGASALFFLERIAASPVSRDRDVIVIEQRGNGYSEPNLLCDPGDVESPDAIDAAKRECRDQIVRRGVNLQAYNTTESSADVADLRRLLGIDSWNVLGTSFGTFWGLRYVSVDPEGVRSMILDSPYPPLAGYGDSWISHLNGPAAVFAACRADPACDAAYPDLKNRFIATYRALTAEPVEAGGQTYNGDALFGLVYNTTFETASVAYTPRLIDAVIRGDLETAGEIIALDPYVPPRGYDVRKGYAWGLNLVLPCIDDATFAAEDRYRLELSEDWPDDLKAAAVRSVVDKGEGCEALWGVTAADPVLNAPVISNAPALIIAGALDPETPPIYGEFMRQGLANGTFIVLPDSAHAALSSPSACAAGIVTRFLDDPAARPDVACVRTLKPRFSLPGEPIVLTEAGR